eukprot:scaffold3970_cov257-Pinguiococcus_pyrenoidosus.AAC.8
MARCRSLCTSRDGGHRVESNRNEATCQASDSDALQAQIASEDFPLNAADRKLRSREKQPGDGHLGGGLFPLFLVTIFDGFEGVGPENLAVQREHRCFLDGVSVYDVAAAVEEDLGRPLHERRAVGPIERRLEDRRDPLLNDGLHHVLVKLQLHHRSRRLRRRELQFPAPLRSPSGTRGFRVVRVDHGTPWQIHSRGSRPQFENDARARPLLPQQPKARAEARDVNLLGHSPEALRQAQR